MFFTSHNKHYAVPMLKHLHPKSLRDLRIVANVVLNFTGDDYV